MGFLQNLCKSKEEGGLGFHDIERFNQALLAKQAWRVWSKPESLLSRVLKSRYFKNGSFLECGMGSRPSYAWRSILHGRELLKEGMVREIGNGRDTNVWAEKWIMDKVPKYPMYREDSTIDLTLTVADLLLPGSSSWNEALVRRTFIPTDAEIVLKIRPNLQKQDSRKWGLTRNGCYSSQSGYRFLDTLRFINGLQQGLPPVEKQVWKKIWKIGAPSKIRHFLWRALSGALAVKERLRPRGIQLDTTCSVCSNAAETICHALFTCPRAQEVWVKSNIRLPNGGFSRNYVFLNLHHLAVSNGGSRNTELNGTFPWIIWEIWKARNAHEYEKKQTGSEMVLSMATEAAEEWRHANFRDPSTSLEPPVSLFGNRSTQGWQPLWEPKFALSISV